MTTLPTPDEVQVEVQDGVQVDPSALPTLDDMHEITLNTQQCAEVAYYMYRQWQEAMKPPLFSYVTFDQWLQQLIERKEDESV